MFDHRSHSKSFDYRWESGNGDIRIFVESCISTEKPQQVELVLIVMSMHDWGRYYSPEPEHYHYYLELSPTLKRRWEHELRDFTSPELSSVWPEIVAHMGSVPRLPDGAREYFLKALRDEVTEAVKTAIFLEHHNMMVFVDVTVKSDVPDEKNADEKTEDEKKNEDDQKNEGDQKNEDDQKNEQDESHSDSAGDDDHGCPNEEEETGGGEEKEEGEEKKEVEEE